MTTNPESPQTRYRIPRRTLVVLAATGALFLAGCGGSSPDQEPSGTTVVSPAPTTKSADGQFETSLVFYPDGSAVSTVENPEGSNESFEGMTTHYSCPGGGPHLQISSSYAPYYARAAGGTQLIENSALCTDGEITPNDFKPHEPIATTTTGAPGN